MKSIRLLVACTALLIGAATAAGPASAAPAVTAGPVTVVPSTGLAGGDTVAVSAAAITPSAAVQVIQCSKSFFDQQNFGYTCYPVTTTTADPAGNVSVDVTLADPVYVATPLQGDDVPLYCRADTCRIYLVWNDSSGSQHAIASQRLLFKGSPATITAQPATNLPKKKRVYVTGTAYGARGHTVLIREEACYRIQEGSGCYGAWPAVSTTVQSGGSYAAYYPVRRFLADGTDCTNVFLGLCELNVTVLDNNGNPDDSFGVSRIGDPAAWLSFRTG